MRDVVGWEGIYQVTSCGKIWSCRHNKFLKPAGGKGNYQMVYLTNGDRKVNDYVHRIVAKAYLPNPNNLPLVNHKDEHKDNNNVNNLEWCSQEYNVNYSIGKRNNCGKWRKVYCPELNKTFPTLASAAKEVGVTIGAIWHAVHGNCKTVKGYHFEYADINQQ